MSGKPTDQDLDVARQFSGVADEPELNPDSLHWELQQEIASDEGCQSADAHSGLNAAQSEPLGIPWKRWLAE